MPVNLPTNLLRNFVAIIETGSMLRAADTALVSQSALSLQVKRLEDLVQQELFHRHGRRLTLTPAGEVMLGFSRQILSLHDEALAAVSMGLEGIGKMLDRVEKVLPPFSDHPPIGG